MKARELGIKFPGKTGKWNAITDVSEVEVGYSTIIKGDGQLVIGKGPIRTGVTMILPRGKKEFLEHNPSYAAWYSLNGNGEMTGTTWIEESGMVEGPIALTNTHSVGTVHDSIVSYYVSKGVADVWILPVVAETYDGFLNDINGFHVKEQHVFDAIETATTGNLEEGNVGGGTGMICHGFKGGTGTSSRIINIRDTEYTIGVLVQANYGDRKNLTIRGIPVGEKLIGNERRNGLSTIDSKKNSSIIVIVATNAPLLPFQLKKLVKRVPIGIGRVGGFGANSSGDIFLAFSTYNNLKRTSSMSAEITIDTVKSLNSNLLDTLYSATIEATEEAIINALVSAQTMVGVNGNTVYQIPIDQLKKILIV